MQAEPISLELLIREAMRSLHMVRGHYYAGRKTISLTIDPRLVFSRTCNIRQDYYFTTIGGIYRLKDGKLYRLTSSNSYGLAFAGEDAYCSIDKGHCSLIVRFPRRYLEGNKKKCIDAKVVYSAMAYDMRGRIHQITSQKNGPVWAANTSRNTLLKITPGAVTEYAPLLDGFSAPILFDHNHLNSVVDYGDFQLFSAFNAGSGALVGLIRDDQVSGFFYPNSSTHDIYMTESGFVLCDMLGDAKKFGGLVTENGFDNSLMQSKVPGYAVRGLSICQGEMLVGLSVKRKKRTERIKGNAIMLVVEKGKVKDEILVPSSQIYQVIHSSGESITPSPQVSYEDAFKRLEQAFGAPCYQGTMTAVLKESPVL